MRLIPLLLITICCISICQSQQKVHLFGTYAEGYYIDVNKNTHHGLIKFSDVNDWITFKTGPKEQPVTLTPKEFTGFVVGKDSFTVVGDFQVPSGFTGATISNAFARVIKTGVVTLYHHATLVGSGDGGTAVIRSYLLQRDADDPIIRVPDNPVNFQKRLAAYFSDHESLNEKIKKGTLTYAHIVQIVEIYNKENTATPLTSQSENGF